MLDKLTLDGNGSERIESIRLSDQGVAWITAVSDSSNALGSSNYNASAPIDPFASGKPDNTLGNDVLVIRVDAVNGGRSGYRVGTNAADGSVGGKILDDSETFLLRVSSPKTAIPQVNGSPINFEAPFSKALSNEYFLPFGLGDVGKAFYYVPGSQAEVEKYLKSTDLGLKVFNNTSSGRKYAIGNKMMLNGNISESYNSFYVDDLDSLMQRWLQIFGGLSIDNIASRDPFNAVAAEKKIILFGSDYEMAYLPKISADSHGNIYFVGQLKKDNESGKFVPYDGLTLVKASQFQSAGSVGTPSSNSGGKGSAFSTELLPSQSIGSVLASISQGLVLSPGATKDLVIADGATLKINAPGWSETIQLIRVAQAATSGSRLQTRQPEDGLQGKFGSLVVGGDGADVITGGFGWDIADGGAGNDLVKVGNGRDILCGGLGADELWGGFGWNTFRSEKDGSSDLLVIRSDQWLSNPRQNNTAGNNADGSKTDVIEALDSIDRIVIQGCESSQITVRANASANGLSGIGIYAMGYLEALYIGGELTTTQLQLMATGDNSQGAIDNTVFSYRGEWSL